jgi:hypothetical protein
MRYTANRSLQSSEIATDDYLLAPFSILRGDVEPKLTCAGNYTKALKLAMNMIL